jgi:hypothetical protein
VPNSQHLFQPGVFILLQVTILFGVPGAGMVQSVWLPPGARTVQWVPAGVNVSAEVLTRRFSPAAPHVQHMTCFARRSVRSGWGTGGPVQNSTSVIDASFYSYWIHQDALVPEHELIDILHGFPPEYCHF